MIRILLYMFALFLFALFSIILLFSVVSSCQEEDIDPSQLNCEQVYNQARACIRKDRTPSEKEE